MIIKKFRIKNYKSIVDSGDCYLEDGLTIFAGKNACGKTTILEALENFNLDKEIDINTNTKGASPIRNLKISITFIISIGELRSYYKKFGIPKVDITEQEIEITKHFPKDYRFENNTTEILEFQFFNTKQQEIINSLTQAYNNIAASHNAVLKDLSPIFTFTTNINNLKSLLQEYNNKIISYYGNLTTPDKIAHKSSIITNINSMNSFINQYDLNNNNRVNSRDYILSLIPNFILFKSFNENLPNKINFDETLTQNAVVQDIQKVIPCNFIYIKKQSDSEQRKRKDIINKTLNEKYCEFWKQDDSKLDIEWRDDSIFFWVKNDNDYFEWSEESQGKQWHILFFFKVMAKSINGKQNIILIDEPGSALHATAQVDIYKMLIEVSQKSQVLFTTHSPYLILEKELHRVRLVIKKSVVEGTKVENKIHKGADKETLTPIMTAIGLSLNEGIHSVDKHYNVIVEGMSDIYYLRAFGKIIGNNKYNFVFGGSSSKIHFIGAILNGWGCKTIYLLDNDKTNSKNDPAKKLAEEWHVEPQSILKVKDIIGTIEDVFTQKDYVEKVLEDPSIVFETTNGEFAKNTDKVLKAKLFLNKIEKGEILLEETTMNNLISVFKKFDMTFSLFGQFQN